MNVIKQYKRKVVENKNIILFSIALTIAIRLTIFFFADTTFVNEYTGNGYLWTNTLVSILSNEIISFILSTLFTFIIAFYASQLNEKHGLIRDRTYLIYTFGCLIFSSLPIFIYMTYYHIAALAFLICTDLLYSSYQDKTSNKNAYAIGFIIGTTSLFSFFFLAYLPLFWIGFSLMRIFNIKKIVVSILGIGSIYWLAFFFFLSQNNISEFVEPFTHLYPILHTSFDTFSLTGESLLICIALVLLIIISLDYQTNSFKDKIRIRANIQFLNISSLYSILAFFFIIFDPTLNLFILACSMTLLLAHFFTLAEQKWKIIAFYILVLGYFSCCVLNLLNWLRTPI